MSDERSVSEVVPIATSALKVGAVTGASGILFGSAVGILRSAHPALFAVASGVQWFGLGTLYWGFQRTLLEVPDGRINQPQRASAVAGAVSGGMMGVVSRGRRSVLPGALFFGTLGYAGQRMQSILQNAASNPQSSPGEPMWKRIAGKLNLFQRLSDAEYEGLLTERLLEIDSEIAVIEEDIRTFKSQRKE